MKTKTLFLSVLTVLTLAACQKENDGMMHLTIEGMGGDSKMAVQDSLSYWATGDQVRINSTTVTIDIGTSGSTATTTVSVDAADAYYGVYPASVYSGNSGASYTLDLPSTYTYATTTRHGRTYQNLQEPMVGYTTSNDMMFKHVTAAINVQVKNDFGVDVRVTDITISSNKYQLSGSTSVTIEANPNVSPVAAEGDANVALRNVQMGFDGAQLIVPCGESAIVQVPVLPVGNDNRFTISVTVQNKDDADMTWTFSKTQAGNSSDGYALGRATIGYAPTKFGAVYAINAAGDEVRFSPGNLQYIGSAATPYWKFATHQYDYIGSAQGSSSLNQDRDLFGWGTSGYDNTVNDAFAINFYPYSTAENPATYSSDASSAYQNNRYGYGPSLNMADVDLTGTSANYDWGVYNAISNGGNSANIWRTLSKDEFGYILNTRTTAYKIGYTATRYIYACLLGTYHGIIILPSDYVHPSSVTTPVFGSAGWSSNAYSADDWEKMEVAGAVFLPAAGQRKGATFSQNETQGNYWTTTNSNSTNSNYYYFSSSSVKTTSNYRYYGYSVRLVRDVN